MTILLSVTGFQPTEWLNALQDKAPRRAVILEPNSANDASVDYAIVWKQKPGVLAGLPNLKAIFSIGAGVDHILRDPHLPDVPIVRIVAEDLTARMSEYVVWRVLDHFRRGMAYRTQQAAGIWHDRVQPAAHEMTVGIMGLGELGRDAAHKLGVLGFNIVGWSRTEKTVAGVDSFHGAAGLDPFLARTDILVVLLPITPETQGILDTGLFSRLKHRTPIGGPVLINAGRGGLQVESAILKALDDEHADGGLARRVRDRAAARFQPVVEASEGLRHPACRSDVERESPGAPDPRPDRRLRTRRGAAAPRRPAGRLLSQRGGWLTPAA